MSTIRFVTPDGLPAFLAYLSQNGRRVLVPVEKPANKRSVVFEPWQEGKPCTMEKATVPAKEAVLPQCETLVRYKTKDPENLERARHESGRQARRPSPPWFLPAAPVTRARLCRARPPLPQGPLRRPLLWARREQLAVVTLTCAAAATPASATGLAAAPPRPKARTCS